VVLAQVVGGGSDAVRVFGVTLVGVSPRTGVKLLFTAALILGVLLLRSVFMTLVRRLLGVCSIWVNPGDRRAFLLLWGIGVALFYTAVLLAATTGLGDPALLLAGVVLGQGLLGWLVARSLRDPTSTSGRTKPARPDQHQRTHDTGMTSSRTRPSADTSSAFPQDVRLPRRLYRRLGGLRTSGN